MGIVLVIPNGFVPNTTNFRTLNIQTRVGILQSFLDGPKVHICRILGFQLAVHYISILWTAVMYQGKYRKRIQRCLGSMLFIEIGLVSNYMGIPQGRLNQGNGHETNNLLFGLTRMIAPIVQEVVLAVGKVGKDVPIDIGFAGSAIAPFTTSAEFLTSQIGLMQHQISMVVVVVAVLLLCTTRSRIHGDGFVPKVHRLEKFSLLTVRNGLFQLANGIHPNAQIGNTLVNEFFHAIFGVVPKIHITMVQLHFLSPKGILDDTICIIKFAIVIVVFFKVFKRAMTATPHARLGTFAQINKGAIIVVGFRNIISIMESFVVANSDVALGL
mmetsp:Transcript_41385/g.99697  ORF Transcript_41385/g.99697 Transcript_41385/m.99697 type:complete len:327 (+) Transcript_41385:779-1759(+)